jgi:hypothetical protein
MIESANGFMEEKVSVRKGCGNSDAIGVMLCERNMEHGIYVCMLFVDVKKAFDRVNWIKMMQVLKTGASGLEGSKGDKR